MTVYVDVLLAVNLYINYFLVRGAALMLRRDISARRCLGAGAVGALFSLFVLLPELPFLVCTLIKLTSGAAVVFTAFGRCRYPELIIRLLCFWLISFVYAGLMLALWVFAAPFGMFYRNGIAYFDIPIIYVALITICGYGAVRLFRYYADRKALSSISADITISDGTHTVAVKGTADTGNNLRDPFSGIPVIICCADAIQTLIPDSIQHFMRGDTDKLCGIRLVPCHTVSGSGIVPVFEAEIKINGAKVDAVIGVTDREIGAECIFNPKLLSI